MSAWFRLRLVTLLVAAGMALGSAAAPAAVVAQADVTTTDLGTGENTARPMAVVDGFRSAKFGMTEPEVLEAIAADFGLSGDAITAGENRAERTRVLTIMAPDLLPDGGTAQVSYVFGYRSGGLIQVGVSWSRLTDPEMTEEKLQGNAEVLVSYFQGIGYDPQSIRTGLLIENGILLFRGEDAQRRATILLMQGQFTDTEDGQRVLTPVALALLYAADSENPDVFSVEPGQF